ncbi:MAG: hypothetical protein H6585_08405 [Flavobacteriales bacterium]|nr:hypothetical protein [Flavobacteriales bacterium]MCB9448350.1 hypothetical protein [Flavobacteriales bacterium]
MTYRSPLRYLSLVLFLTLISGFVMYRSGAFLQEPPGETQTTNNMFPNSVPGHDSITDDTSKAQPDSIHIDRNDMMHTSKSALIFDPKDIKTKLDTDSTHMDRKVFMGSSKSDFRVIQINDETDSAEMAKDKRAHRRKKP